MFENPKANGSNIGQLRDYHRKVGKVGQKQDIVNCVDYSLKLLK